MINDSFLNMAQDRSEESMLIEQADQSMAHPNLVTFVVGDSNGKRGCALTFRVWIIGIILNVTMSIVSQISSMRTLQVTLSPLILTVLAYPLGVIFSSILPRTPIKVGSYRFILNPGPFSLREHSLALLLANGGNMPSIGLVTEYVRETFFNQSHHFAANCLTGLAPCLIGAAIGGLTSNLVVWPEDMVWPGALMHVSLIKALHERRYFPSASRIKFFWYVAFAAFLYHFIPSVLFTALTSISIMCWINPASPVLSQLGSGLHGLGIGTISLDWSLITAYMPSPLIYPFYAAANLFFGFVLFMWILVPMGYYSNLWDTQRYPIQSFRLYNLLGLPYATDKVHDGGKLILEAYQDQGPVRMTWLFFLSYFFAIAAVSAAFTHIILYHGHDLLDHFQSWINSLTEKNSNTSNEGKASLINNSNGLGRRKKRVIISDQHNPPTPTYWYWILLVIGFILGICGVASSPAKESVSWYMILGGIIVGLGFSIPVSWITGMTSHIIHINVLVQLLAGVLWPQNGLANLYFRNYSYFPTFVAITYCLDLKIGQYMKLPQRQVFLVKIAGMIMSNMTQAIVMELMLARVPGICSPQNEQWGCTFFNAVKPSSFIWGTISPINMFNSKSIYHPMVYAILVGFLVPIPFYLLHLKFPGSLFSYVNIPIVLSATIYAPAAPTAQFVSWFLVAFIFNYLIYRWKPSWWLRKNLLVNCSLETGTVVANVLVGLILAFVEIRPQWWGNDPMGNCPLAGMPLSPSPAAIAMLQQQANA